METTFELRGRARFGSGTSGGTFATLLLDTDDPTLTNPFTLTDRTDSADAVVRLQARRTPDRDWLAPLM